MCEEHAHRRQRAALLEKENVQGLCFDQRARSTFSMLGSCRSPSSGNSVGIGGSWATSSACAGLHGRIVLRARMAAARRPATHTMIIRLSSIVAHVLEGRQA